MATKFEKYGCATFAILFFGGVFCAALSGDYPQPPSVSTSKQPDRKAAKIDVSHAETREDQEKLNRSLEKTFAVSIVLSGYGCSKVVELSRRSVNGSTLVSCIERRGKPGISKYLIDEERLFGGKGDAVRAL